MKSAPVHPAEAPRLETIDALGLLEESYVDCYDRIIRLAAFLFDTPISAFTVVAEDKQFFKALHGLDVRVTSREVAFCAHAINGNEPFVVEDTLEDERFADNPLVTGSPNIRFYAGIPVKAPNAYPVGTICVIDRKPRKISERELAALDDLKGLIEDAMLMQSFSVRDHLTGMFNRRHFDDVLAREWRRAYRRTLPISILLLDLDHFKQFNDRHGHQAGDECLRTVAATLRQEMRRPGDLVARYGGEEFVAVLPEAGADGARVIAERIRTAIEALGIERGGTEGGVVTVSIGGAVALRKEDLITGPETVLANADEALYRAKRAGRNRVEWDDAKVD